MAQEDFQERADAASCGRGRARLEAVSGDSGEEAEASASAGAPALIPTGWKDLVDAHPEVYVLAPGGRVVYYEEHIRWTAERRGRRTRGILNEGALMDTINSALMADPERRARVEELVCLGRNLTRFEVRALREALVGGVAREKLNTEVVAAHYGIKRRAARNLVRAANSPMGREADSMPLTKADMNELREELEVRYEALHADVRATLAVVLERFPESDAVRAAVDEFLDGTLRD